MNNDIAFRAAWNRGFEQRFAELGMVKEALRGDQVFRKAFESASNLGTFRRGLKPVVPDMAGAAATRFQGLARNAAKGSDEAKALAASLRQTRGARPMPAGKTPWDPAAAKARSEARAKSAPASDVSSKPGAGYWDYPDGIATPASATATGNASRLGWQIPKATGWGADQRNWLSDNLWNDRGAWGRAGVVGAGAQLASMHSHARGAQNAYDEFKEQHPILSTFARLGGVSRPGYFSSIHHPLNPLGIL